jgi:N-acetylglucosaminyldiphosphoundecaprenol N-acetyl-beta-D-mannosaminyltransferase
MYMKKNDSSVNILGLSLFGSNKEQLLALLKNKIYNSNKISYIYTPNPEQVVQSRGHDEISKRFLQALNDANILLPDGIGLVLASNYLYARKKIQKPLSERITGADVTTNIIEILGQSTQKLIGRRPNALLIGGRGYSELRLAQLSDQYGVSLVWEPAYQDVANQTDSETQHIIKKIAQIKPKVVFVAFGAPYQEIWLHEHRAELEKAGVVIGMAVGGSFDFLLGITPRAPVLMQNLGLEWLFRLLIQPWRWRRQLRLLEFCWIVAKS